MSKEGTAAGTVIVAFALGALAGAAIALLYAPAAGEETRRRLAERAREGRARADQAFREGTEALKKHGDELAGAVEAGLSAFDRVRKETL